MIDFDQTYRGHLVLVGEDEARVTQEHIWKGTGGYTNKLLHDMWCRAEAMGFNRPNSGEARYKHPNNFMPDGVYLRQIGAPERLTLDHCVFSHKQVQLRWMQYPPGQFDASKLSRRDAIGLRDQMEDDRDQRALGNVPDTSSSSTGNIWV